MENIRRSTPQILISPNTDFKPFLLSVLLFEDLICYSKCGKFFFHHSLSTTTTKNPENRITIFMMKLFFHIVIIVDIVVNVRFQFNH